MSIRPRGEKPRDNLYSVISKAIETTGGTVRLIAVLLALACLVAAVLNREQLGAWTAEAARWLARS